MANPNLISTAIPNPFADPDLHNLVRRHQMHSCTNYCFRGTADACRFGFPKESSPDTHIDPETQKVVYQRTIYDDRVSNYSPYLLKLIRANMDIQINNDENVLFYLAKYLTKMDDVTNITLNDEPNRIVRQHFRGRIIGSVEAVYDILAFHKHRRSRGVIYTDTSLPGQDQRRQLVHNFKDLPDNSTNIFIKTHVEKYERRDRRLVNINLIQYTRYYRVIFERGGNNELDLDLDEEEEFVVGHGGRRPGVVDVEGVGRLPLTAVDLDNRVYAFRQHLGALPLWRTHDYTVRDGELFYYQQIVLHHQSFNFNTEKGNRSWQQFFNDLADNLPFEDDTYLETIRAQEHALNQEAAGLANAANIRELDLGQMLEIANPLQLQVYMDIVSDNVTGPVFVTGGGGVGKSFPLRMIELGLQRQHQVHVVKLAPTRIASQNIGGQTLHRFFGMSNVVSIPNPIRLDEFVKTHDRAAFLIDEVSMISFELFDIINSALVTATNTNAWFGGIFCVFFGDFAQLPPGPTLGRRSPARPPRHGSSSHLYFAN